MIDEEGNPMTTKAIPANAMTTTPPEARSGSGAAPAVVFEPPGPGSWELDSSHQSRPRGRLMSELFDDNFTDGFRSTFARYGMPLEALVAKTVNGWVYMKAKPVGAPEKAGGSPPPDIVLKLVTRLHPELRRRTRTARAALAEKRWLRDAETWTTERPSWIAAGSALLAQSVEDLSDAELGEHVRRAIEQAQTNLQRHFELVGASVAAGRLLVAGGKWGFDRTEIFDLLRGASPASAGTVAPLRRIASLVAATGEQPATFDDLVALRDRSPEIGELVDDYVHHFGWRVFGDDAESPCLMDDPDHLIALVAAAGDQDESPALDPSASIDRLRERVPVGDRSQFDELVDEARRAYGSLDDNSGVVCWFFGIVRRAVLEVARRAEASGRLDHASDVWNLSPEEVVDVAGGGHGPGGTEMQAREAARVASVEPPAVLGGAPGAPPSPEVFPPPMAEMVAAFGAFISGKFGDQPGEASPAARSKGSGRMVVDGRTVAEGHGVGSEAVTARVVVSDDVADAMTRIEPGDILVCPYTTAAWNSVFPLLGGIVTAHGGPIGHTGVMAREFYLPAVIGIGEIDPSWDGRIATLEMN